MLLQHSSEVTEYFKDVGLHARIFVELATNGQRPGDARPIALRGLSLTMGERNTTAFVPAGSEALGFVLAELIRRPLWVWDVYEESLAFAALFKLRLPIAADVVLARHLLKPRVPTIEYVPHSPKAGLPASMSDADAAERAERLLPVMWNAIEADYESILTYGQRVPYEIELEAAGMLAHAAALGYRREHERVYPTWRTTHFSGSTNITAGGPPLTSTPLIERREYAADLGRRWVQIEWPDVEVAVLAARTGSPWLKDAYRGGQPYEPLGTIWNVEPDEARTIFRVLLSTGPDEELAQTKLEAGTEYVRLLARMAPEWVEWGARLREAASADYGHVTALLGRAIKVDEPRKACSLDVQASQAMLLKMLLARLHVESETSRAWAGFSSPIPVYSKVAYQIDTHVPLDVHVPAALYVGRLLAAPDLPLCVTVSMGPTWGHLTPVTAAKTSQAEQELLSPATYAIQCPVCEAVASDEATLVEHLGDAHNTTTADIEALVEQARELRG